jgi:UDP-N-acetylmuramoyl-L-alanyl-D-glutamate--2,6-diaminopimelate ligase
MKITSLAGAVPGFVQIIGAAQEDVKSLCADSRKVERDALFFCIPGLRIDAHEFAPQAIEAGACALVVERKLDVACTQIVVRDVREALSFMAARFYGDPTRE